MPRDFTVPALLTQEGKIRTGGLAAGENNQVGIGPGVTHFHKGQLHLRMQTQRIEIIVVTHPRQHRHHDLERTDAMVTLFINGVFRVQGKPMQIGQHPENRFAGARFQPVQATLQ